MKKIKMTRDNFQPKLSNLWSVEIKGAIDSQYVKSCMLPIITKTTNFWGKKKDKFSPLVIEILEPMGISYYKTFKQSLDNNSEWELDIFQVDPKGEIVDRYRFHGSTVKSVSKSTLDYNISKPVSTKIYFQPKSVEFVD